MMPGLIIKKLLAASIYLLFPVQNIRYLQEKVCEIKLFISSDQNSKM